MGDLRTVNLIAGSGAHRGPGGWIFSRMTSEIENRINERGNFSVTVSESPDTSKPYDVYHYLHSTLAVQHKHMLHRSLVTVVAMDDLFDHRTFASKKETLQKAKYVSAISTTTAQDLCDRGVSPDKLCYTPLGVPLNDFIPQHNFTKVMKQLEDGGIIIPDENINNIQTVRFGIVGRRYDDGRKGEEFLCRSIRKLMKKLNQNQEICLVFVGPNWDTCEEILGLSIPDSVMLEFHPDLPYELYPSIYNTLDAVLVSSKTEGGPMCILEALACGIYVISTPGGHANEFLTREDPAEDGNSLGRIVGYGDAPGFATAIKEGVFDHIDDIRSEEMTRRRSMVLRETSDITYRKESYISEDCFAPYDWEHFSQNFEQIYESIAEDVSEKVVVSDYISEQDQDRFRAGYRDGARGHLADIYVRNFMQIMPYAQSGIGVVRFTNALKGIPTVITGMGPSLDDHMKMIKEHRDDIALIVCDAGVKKMLAADIIPDMVIVADPTEKQIENLTDIDGSGFITLLPTIVHPMVFDAARRSNCNMVWYNVADGSQEICKHIPRVIGPKGAIEPAVLTTGMAFLSSLMMGSWPITFTGMDLCWYDFDRGYASGVSETKKEWQKRNKMLGNVTTLFPDIDGKTVVTEPCFLSFWQWMNDYLGENDLYTYNSSGCGILHGERIRQMEMKLWLTERAAGGRAIELRDKLLKTYQLFRANIDTIACHQFTDEDMDRIRDEINLAEGQRP